MQVYGFGFCYGSRFFEKTGFRQKLKFRKIFFAKKLIFLSFGDIFTLPNACAVQLTLLNQVPMKCCIQTVLENMGCWQKESETEKMVGCFKVPPG